MNIKNATKSKCYFLFSIQFSSFEDVGHSADARAMTEDYLVGELVEEEQEEQIVQELDENAVVPAAALREKEEEGWLSILTSPVCD